MKQTLSSQGHLNLQGKLSEEKDLFLCHTGADKHWVEELGQRIEAEPYKDRNLAVVLDKWDFRRGTNVVLELEKFLDSARFVGIVVTKAMLEAEWPTLERSIAVWSDVSGSRGRVIPLLRENVTLPATLRVRNWIDFRNEEKFDESFSELIHYLRGDRLTRGRGSFQPKMKLTGIPQMPTPILITASTEADHVRERLVLNIYRVTCIPETVFYATTKLREKREIHEYLDAPPPFILREGKLYTFTDLRNSAVFRAALTTEDGEASADSFADWFSDDEYKRRAIELLNVYLKQHAWERRLRFDATKGRYFFPPSNGKPKRISWLIGGRSHSREVTAQHKKREKQDDGSFRDVAFGWRHQALRASFMLAMGNLMLKLEPTYLLTKDDGKTPRTSRWVGPILSPWTNQERNGQILRSLRFWSLLLAGGRELRIETGQLPISVDLTPISGFLDLGIGSDQLDFDALMEAEIEDDNMPQLELMFGEEGSIRDAEDPQFQADDGEAE